MYTNYIQESMFHPASRFLGNVQSKQQSYVLINVHNSRHCYSFSSFLNRTTSRSFNFQANAILSDVYTTTIIISR